MLPPKPSLETYEAARPSEELFRLRLSHGGDEPAEPVPDDVALTLGSLPALLVVALELDGVEICRISETRDQHATSGRI